MKVASLRKEAAAIDCDPKQATEAAAPVFALNAGLAAFAQNCAGGDRLPQTGGTDGLLLVRPQVPSGFGACLA